MATFLFQPVYPIGMRFRLMGLVLLVFVIIPEAAQAQLSNIQYSTTPDGSGGLVIAGFSATGSGALSIPGTINALPVTGIASQAFNLDANLTSVTIPGSVTNIGYGPFGGCTNLTSITMGTPNSSYSSAGGVLFNNNQTQLIQYPAGGVSTYTIPNSVTSLGDHAFFYCTNLTGVTIPGSVTYIGNAVFYRSSLTSVTFPASVTNIGYEAFNFCTNLASAIFLGNAPTMGQYAFTSTGNGFTVTYDNGSGFTSPTWTDNASDTYPAVNAGPFGSVSLGGNWYYSAWFGTYNVSYFPWINHNSLGFIYTSTSNNTDIYLYVLNGSSGSMGWLYTTQAHFPNGYSFSKGTWLYYSVGTTSFYNYQTAAWETY